MDITCPHCHQVLEAEETLNGEIVDCPGCGQSFLVSMQSPVSFPIKTTKPTTENKRINEPDVSLERKIRNKKRLWIIGCLVVAAATGLIVSAVLITNHNRAVRNRQYWDDYFRQENERKQAEIAQQNAARSKYELGMRYYEGDGVLQDFNKAVPLLIEASEMGHSEASAKLASIYKSGRAGQEKNLSLAAAYARKAGDSTLAKMILGDLYFYGYEDDSGLTVQDDKMAYQFYSESSNFYYSSYMKGMMEYHGVGTPVNKEKAAETFFFACKSKPDAPYAANAAMCLGYMYWSGEGVAKNMKEAKNWMQYGKETGYNPHDAMFDLVSKGGVKMDLFQTAVFTSQIKFGL